MKKSLLLVALVVFVPIAAFADIASVRFVHSYVTDVWDITLPASVADSNIVSMKYLMSIVDRANAELNGGPTTDYAHDPVRATSHIVSAAAARAAVEKLITPDYKFFFTPETNDSTYMFRISAAGIYYVDWGDGNWKQIVKSTVGYQDISHTYEGAAGDYEIKLAGRAVEYSDDTSTAAISFSDDAARLKAFRGCLGCIFSTIDDESVAQRQPRFWRTFAYSPTIQGEIPAELFKGVHGAPVSHMFYGTFLNCSGLTGGIPETLFSGIRGAPADYIFLSTFSGCSGLTGTIPEKLFSGVRGSPASNMFYGTFYNCANLTGEIPEKLFAGIRGAPAYRMFCVTFFGCSGLSSIGGNLFAGIKGVSVSEMFQRTFSGCTGLSGKIPAGLFDGIDTSAALGGFYETFYDCSNLTGPSAQIGGRYLYDIWPNAGNQQTYYNAIQLSDYDCIPKSFGGGGTKEPGECEE